MSNFDSTKKINASLKKTTKSDSGQQARWSFIQSDLGSAASEWNQTEISANVKTQDQVQFEKVKSMIENLKDKLNEF